MKKIIIRIALMGKCSIRSQGIYSEYSIYRSGSLRMTNAGCLEIRLPTRGKCAMPVVFLPRPRRLNGIQSISVAVHKTKSPV